MPQSLVRLIMHLKPYWLQDIGSHAHNPVTEGPDIDLVGQQVGRGGDTVLIFDNGGNPVAEYAASDAGLTAALAALGSGDICQIPSITIAGGPWTIPAGGELQGFSRYQSNLQGTVILGDESIVGLLNILKTANDANVIYGIQGPTTGTGYVVGCHVLATQSGSGNAYAVGAINGAAAGDGNVYVYESHLNGISAGGDGYGARSTAGLFKDWHGICYGSTAPWTTT